MFISPMNGINSLSLFNETQNEIQKTDNFAFGDIFKSAIENVSQNEKSLEQAQYLLSTGQIDDAHTVPIESSMTQLSVDFLVQLRNKALDSYNELMRISL